MAHSVTVQFATRDPAVPRTARIRAWARAALEEHRDAKLTIRIVDEREAAILNERWRRKRGATNVLSFPCEGFEGVEPGLLGDIVICAPVVAREADEQGKKIDAHWAHMVVHGILHLLGHDHGRPSEADRMESAETRILLDLGYNDPYRPSGSGRGRDSNTA